MFAEPLISLYLPCTSCPHLFFGEDASPAPHEVLHFLKVTNSGKTCHCHMRWHRQLKTPDFPREHSLRHVPCSRGILQLWLRKSAKLQLQYLAHVVLLRAGFKGRPGQQDQWHGNSMYIFAGCHIEPVFGACSVLV